MRVFIDSNVILDVALNRGPFSDASRNCLLWCEENATQTFVAFHTVTNGYYLLRRHLDDSQAREFLLELLSWTEVSPTSKAITILALESPKSDVEDTLQGLCAELSGADALVTRDPKGFRNLPIPVFSPKSFLESMSEAEEAD